MYLLTLVVCVHIFLLLFTQYTLICYKKSLKPHKLTSIAVFQITCKLNSSKKSLNLYSSLKKSLTELNLTKF